MTSPGQLDMAGGEQLDPRIEAAARALWHRSARRTWGQDGTDIADSQERELWPRLAKHYRDEARAALTAAGVL